MPDQNERLEELEQLVDRNHRAFERAKRLLDEAKKRAAEKPFAPVPAEPDDVGENLAG
jgi:hypothetical protein